jgi:hypothetical protein
MRKTKSTAMAHQIAQLLETMHRLERLLLTFERDMTPRLYVANYQEIEILCDEFHDQTEEFVRERRERR